MAAFINDYNPVSCFSLLGYDSVVKGRGDQMPKAVFTGMRRKKGGNQSVRKQYTEVG